MLQVYINYPNPHISAHGSISCGDIKKMRKSGQRHVIIDISSIATELQKFSTKQYAFAAAASLNDLWLSVDFQNSPFEMAVVEYIQQLIGEHYRPLAGVAVQRHC